MNFALITSSMALEDCNESSGVFFRTSNSIVLMSRTNVDTLFEEMLMSKEHKNSILEQIKSNKDFAKRVEGADQWTHPAGKPEGTETIAMTAQRESKEELLETFPFDVEDLIKLENTKNFVSYINPNHPRKEEANWWLSTYCFDITQEDFEIENRIFKIHFKNRITDLSTKVGEMINQRKSWDEIADYVSLTIKENIPYQMLRLFPINELINASKDVKKNLLFGGCSIRNFTLWTLQNDQIQKMLQS
jgi:hypothetical protein